MSNPTALVQKLWNYCNILRDDGLSYGDYVEQLTFLLFLKMADEQAQPPSANLPAPEIIAAEGVRVFRERPPVHSGNDVRNKMKRPMNSPTSTERMAM